MTKKKYNIEGLDCANCAKKIEDKIAANPELDEQEKEKIFDTLDHIKGEEAEHIEELEDLVDEPEETEVEEPVEEPTEEPESEDESKVLVEGSGFFGKVILDDYFKKDGVVIIEWADTIQSYLPEERLDIKFKVIDENTRLLIFKPRGQKYEEVCEAVL